jgi:hypothetical protein
VIGSTAIDVAVGLVFTFFLFALLCSGISEWIARLLNRRGKLLYDAIDQLLEGKAADFWKHPLVLPLTKRRSAITVSKREVRAVSRTVAVAGAGGAPGAPEEADPAEAPGAVATPRDQAPSYLSAKTFAHAVIGLFENPDPHGVENALVAELGTLSGAPKLQKALVKLFSEAGGVIDKFRVSIEDWFNDTMDRVSGFYKRQTKRFLLVFAVAVTLLFNVNTLLIGRTLWRDPTTRNAVLVAAQQATATTTTVPDSSATTTTTTTPALGVVYKQIEEEQKVGLPLGWGPPRRPWDDNVGWVFAIVGYLLTIGAISFGAPFWFDMLTRLNSLRASGPPPGTTSAAAE